MPSVENYSKGDNVESEIEVSVPGCHIGTSRMVVSPSSKMRDVITTALNKLKTEQQQLWIGSGPAAVKAVSCVEVIKKRIANLHQITQLVYKKVEEYWEPKLDGLDRLRVVREVPTIIILLSKEPLDSSVFGYQAPGTLGDDFCKFDTQQKRRHKEPRGRHEERNGTSSNHRNQNVTWKFRGDHDGGRWEGGERQRGTQKVNERGSGGHRSTVESRQRFGGAGASDGSAAGGGGGYGGGAVGGGVSRKKYGRALGETYEDKNTNSTEANERSNVTK